MQCYAMLLFIRNKSLGVGGGRGVEGERSGGQNINSECTFYLMFRVMTK